MSNWFVLQLQWNRKIEEIDGLVIAFFEALVLYQNTPEGFWMFMDSFTSLPHTLFWHGGQFSVEQGA